MHARHRQHFVHNSLFCDCSVFVRRAGSHKVRDHRNVGFFVAHEVLVAEQKAVGAVPGLAPSKNKTERENVYDKKCLE